MADILNKIDLKKRLMSDMGFSEKKTSIYLSLLEIGEATASEIAKRSKLKRTTVYNIIPELLQEGLLHKYKSKKKTLFFVDNTKDLLFRLEERKSSISEIIPELDKLHFIKPTRPKIIQYEGQNGIIQLYKDMLDSINQGEELLSIIGADYAKDIMPFHTLTYYSDLRLKKKIRHRIIGTNNEFINKFKEKDKDELRETRILNDGDELIGSDIRIFGNKVALLSFSEGFIGVIIESPDLNKLMKVIFEKAWKELEK
jgi:sugar-specific transcriptional regulator TrmB